MEWLTGFLTGENMLALVTLTALEIVLGIDNIIFIAILSGKLPREQQDRARTTGLIAAMFMRIALLLGVGFIHSLKAPWFTFNVWDLHVEVSGRSLILVVGGLVLMAKSVREIYHKTEGAHDASMVGKATTFASVIAQIMLMDLVFSIDSVITAVGMAQSIAVMVIAVIVSVAIMMVFAGPISRFVDRRPSLKMLALAFLLLIGFMLVAEGFHHEVPKGYIYFAMAFALGVELLNMRMERKRAVEARGP